MDSILKAIGGDRMAVQGQVPRVGLLEDSVHARTPYPRTWLESLRDRLGISGFKPNGIHAEAAQSTTAAMLARGLDPDEPDSGNIVPIR
jgi:hypothetical protein